MTMRATVEPDVPPAMFGMQRGSVTVTRHGASQHRGRLAWRSRQVTKSTAQQAGDRINKLPLRSVGPVLIRV